MLAKSNGPAGELDGRLRTLWLGRSIAGLFWLLIVLLSCASVSIFSA